MNIGNLSIGIDLDTGKLNSNLDAATTKTKTFGDEIKKYLTMAAAIYAVKQLGDFLFDTAKAAGEAEDAEIMLGQAMQNAGTYTREAFEAANNYAMALMEQSTYTDEAIRGAEKQLIAYGAEGELLKGLTQATLDFATFKKIDLVSAADLVGKAIKSESGQIRGSGIELEGAAGSAEKMRSAVDQLRKLCGGAALAATKSYSGQMTQLNNEYDELKESIGKISIIVLTPFINFLKTNVIPQLQNWFSNTDNVKKITKVLAEVIGGIIKVLVAFVGGIDIATTSLGAMAKIIYDIGTRNFKGLLEDLSPSTKKITEDTDYWSDALKIVDDVFNKMATTTLPSVTDILDKTPKPIQKMASDWATATGDMTTRADLMVEQLGYSLGEEGMKIPKKGFGKFVADMVEAFTPLEDLMTGTATAFQTAFVDAFDKVLVHGQSWNGAMGEVWNSFKETMIKVAEEIIAKAVIVKLLELISSLWDGIGSSDSAAAKISSKAQAKGYNYNSETNDWSMPKTGGDDEPTVPQIPEEFWIVLINGIQEGWESAGEVLNDWGDKLGDIFGWAGGVRNFQGGLSLVGEQGPELINLPRGSDVFSNGETRRMMSGGGSNNPINIVINATVRADEDWEKVTRNKIIPSLERYMKKTYNSPFA